jgi:hypothetical protein
LDTGECYALCHALCQAFIVSRAVIQTGFAAEIDAPAGQAGRGIPRQPILVARALYVCLSRPQLRLPSHATHIRWGDSIEARMAELELLPDWIDTRLKEKFVEGGGLRLSCPTKVD